MRFGFAARPADDDEDDDEPRRPVKKPAADAVQKGTPPKKKPVAKPVDDADEEEEVRKPAKKKPARRDEDEETASARDNTALNLLAPVGGSLWGLAALLFGGTATVLPVVLAILYYLWDAQRWLGKLGYGVVGLAAVIGLFALPLGLLSFIFRPKKSYGGIMSYMRAIVGMILGVVGIILGVVVAIMFVR
jgi:hypothetical protein